MNKLKFTTMDPSQLKKILDLDGPYRRKKIYFAQIVCGRMEFWI